MILLVTLNATYQHCAFGLRYLKANMRELQERTEILELTTALPAKDIAERILARRPSIVGFGVYIWNTRQTEDVIAVLKRISPGLCIVLGGPEVSHEAASQSLCARADHVIQGEADLLFYEFCAARLRGEPPQDKFLRGPLPELSSLCSPYALYSDDDIKNRIIYVEASRGCPYKCEYCLSSLDQSVRSFPLEKFLKDLEELLERGARSFKFVDRTFNLSPTVSTAILRFFLDRIDLGLFLHFEMVPDRLPESLKDLIKRFPPGSLQFEIGIQTWNPEVARNVSRRQDYPKIVENLRFLKTETGVHTHADLIVGLPGESLESFGRGFDALSELEPDEIQVGLLKRLKGTPIVRHDAAFAMLYDESPPFQILRNKDLDFAEVQRMGRFSRFWDLIANSGNFSRWTGELRRWCKEEGRSFFSSFLEISDRLGGASSGLQAPSLPALAKLLADQSRQQWGWSDERLERSLAEDYRQAGKTDRPSWLPKRQRRVSSAESLQIVAPVTPPGEHQKQDAITR